MSSSSEEDGTVMVKEEELENDLELWDSHPRRSAFSPYRVRKLFFGFFPRMRERALLKASIYENDHSDCCQKNTSKFICLLHIL